MRCLKFHDLLKSTVSELKVRYADHLKNCSACREMINDYSQVRRMVLNSAGSDEPDRNKSRCPETVQLLDYLENQTTTEQDVQIQAHLATCDRCVAELIGLQDFLASRAMVKDTTGLKNAKRRLSGNYQDLKWRVAAAISGMIRTARPSVRWAFAATLMLITTTIIWINRSDDSAGLIMRDNTAPGYAPTIEIITPGQNGMLNSGSRKFSWTGPGETVYYNFILLGQEGDIIFEEKVNENQIELPENIYLRKMHPYFWQVEAYLINGATIRSEMIKFFY